MKKIWMNRGMAFWIGGALLLFSLNFARDVVRIGRKFDWTVVERGTVHRGVITNGIMEAVRVADIKSEVDEIVLKKMVKEGESVKEGQPLIELSRAKTQIEFEQRRNAFANAEADAKKAQREVAVQKKLLKNLAVSRQQVEEAEATLEKTKASLEISRQEFQMAKTKLEGTLVRAPMTGVVLKDVTKIGMAVSPGKDIITVGDISKFIVRAKVDELDIQQVKVGQRVEINADAFPGQTMLGSVSSIAIQAERETFAKVEVLIDITDARKLTLKHNLSVRVNILTEDIFDTMSVPIRCILKKDGDSALVVVRNGLHMVSRRRITLGKIAGDRVQVLSGLSSGLEVGAEKTIDAPL